MYQNDTPLNFVAYVALNPEGHTDWHPFYDRQGKKTLWDFICREIHIMWILGFDHWPNIDHSQVLMKEDLDLVGQAYVLSTEESFITTCIRQLFIIMQFDEPSLKRWYVSRFIWDICAHNENSANIEC